MERAESNSERLLVKAKIEGMVALETTWRMGTMGPPQEGDKMWGGQPLLKIFDPREMEVQTLMGEPDGAALKPGTVALVHLDAYPGGGFQGDVPLGEPGCDQRVGKPDQEFRGAVPAGADGFAPAA